MNNLAFSWQGAVAVFAVCQATIGHILSFHAFKAYFEKGDL